MQNRHFFDFLKFFKKAKNDDFVWKITAPRMGLGVFSWCLLCSIFRWLRRGILCFFCRRCFHGEIWKTISPVFRVFQRKLKMVPKKGHFLAFLGQPQWPNDIVVAPHGQDERIGATFASWDTFKNSQEHREFSNLVTLKTAKVSSSAIWLICTAAIWVVLRKFLPYICFLFLLWYFLILSSFFIIFNPFVVVSIILK